MSRKRTPQTAPVLSTGDLPEPTATVATAPAPTPPTTRNDARPAASPAPTPAPTATVPPKTTRSLEERTYNALVRYLSGDLREFTSELVKAPAAVRLERFVPDVEGKLRTVHALAKTLGVTDETLANVIPVPARPTGLSKDTIEKILALRKENKGKAQIAKAVGKRPHVVIEVLKAHGDPGAKDLQEKELKARQAWISSMEKRLAAAKGNT